MFVCLCSWWLMWYIAMCLTIQHIQYKVILFKHPLITCIMISIPNTFQSSITCISQGYTCTSDYKQPQIQVVTLEHNLNVCTCLFRFQPKRINVSLLIQMTACLYCIFVRRCPWTSPGTPRVSTFIPNLITVYVYML